MKPHFSEADLLETYYMRPGESMPVMLHLADCADCAARYERLEAKMQSLRSCGHDEKPETFWARQRISVMRRIGARRAPRIARYAAAATLVIAIGGAAVYESSSRQVVKETPAVVVTPVAVDDSPWQSDELADYSQIVAWESWVENGDQS